MNVVFWIIRVFLVVVFICSLCDACSNKFTNDERAWSLAIGVLSFIMIFVSRQC